MVHAGGMMACLNNNKKTREQGAKSNVAAFGDREYG